MANGIIRFHHELSCNTYFLTGPLYMGKIPGEDLYLVMERLDHSNHGCWQGYFELQDSRKVVRDALDTSVGSRDAFIAIRDGIHEPEERWVAYISRSEISIAIKDSMPSWQNHLNEPYIHHTKRLYEQMSEYYDFAENIVMFVTVTSSPEALLTTHMGVAEAVDSWGDRPKGISMNLHAFAAKVMLMRNPNRLFMVNGPSAMMAKIILKNLPGKVFVGTKEIGAYFDVPSLFSPEELDEIPITNPSILSSDGNYSMRKANYLSVYDPLNRTKILFTIDHADSNYGWIFRGRAAGVGCSLVAVDLNAMANCRETEAF